MSERQTGQERYEELRRRDARFHELHRIGPERFGVDWLRANGEATAAAHNLGIDPSKTDTRALLSETCFRILANFEKLTPPAPARPRIVCLCGSTRFMEAFQTANLMETLEGRIVLSVGCNTKSDIELFYSDTAAEVKLKLDELHKRKIDLADEVFVLNVNGYIGESTRSEINYAQAQGKPIRFLEPVAPEHFFMEGKGE